MILRSRLRHALRPMLKKYPAVWKKVVGIDTGLDRVRHAVAPILPAVVNPEPRYLEVAITAHCNLRCVGCRYGRDFMAGQELSWPVVETLIDDAAAARMWTIRFYGGEPLLHPQLPRMVERCRRLRLEPYVTTNGILLRERIDDLYAAGLRDVTIGFYGTGAKYDDYVQRNGRFTRLEASIAAVRDRYGTGVSLRINWLLMRPSCNLEDLHAVVRFAERYATPIQVDLIHYSLPYFSEGPNRVLQFRPEDRPGIETVVNELLRLKEARPELLTQSATGLRSIPDWLVKGPGMRVPCDSRHMIWVGADGTVQLCYVTFKLGNLHERRLRDMLGGREHRQAARDAFALRCPNCHCHYDRRVLKHAPSERKYAAGVLAGAPRMPLPVN